MSETWGMILAAGLGSRLRPLTNILPKPQIKLANRPIIYHILDRMHQAQIKDVIVNVHYLASRLIKCLSDYDKPLRIHPIYETHILGTAGGVINAIKKFELTNKKLLVAHGDIIFDYDLLNIIKLNHFASLLCVKNKSIDGYEGTVAIDKKQEITQLGKFFISSKTYETKNFFTGIQIFSPNALKELITMNAESLVKDVYPIWLKKNIGLKGISADFYYNDLGDIKRLKEANLIAIKNKKQIIENN